MPFFIMQPPKDEQKFADQSKEILNSAKALGITLDPEGFLMAWASGIRVAIERDDEGVIISMALVAMGKRWHMDDVAATVLEIKGNREQMIEYVTQMASAVGAQSLFVEEEHPEKLDDKTVKFTVIQHHLQ